MELVKTRIDKDIFIAVMNRPDRLNAFNNELITRLREALDEAYGYAGLVITGEGRAFSAGDDIYEMYSIKTLEDAKKFFDNLTDLLRKVMWFPGPVVACLNGFAVGGGAELILLTDYNIAYHDVWLWYPEYRIGVYPPILLALGPLIFGLKETKKIAFTLKKLSADEAYKLGILDEIVERETDILNVGIKRAREMAGLGKKAYIHSRRILAMSYEERLLKVLSSLAEAIMDPEAKKLMRLFVEKKLG